MNRGCHILAVLILMCVGVANAAVVEWNVFVETDYDLWLNTRLLASGSTVTAFHIPPACFIPMGTMARTGSIRTDCVDSGESSGCYFGGDPMFVDIANGDFHLRMGSPCINTGSGWWGSFSTDFDGNPRFVRGATDIGPYEFQPTNETQTITAPIPVEFSWIDEK